MADSQLDKKPAWTQWDIEQAWLEVVAARESGDIDAEALGMRRFSEGLRNSAMGAAGFVLRPLDEKIDDQKAQLSELMQLFRSVRDADLDWRTEERLTRDAQSTRLYGELDKLIIAAEDNSTRLGKHSKELEGLREGQQAYNVRLDEFDIRHGGQWEEAMALYRVLADRLDRKRAELDQIKHDVSEMKAWREAQGRGDAER